MLKEQGYGEGEKFLESSATVLRFLDAGGGEKEVKCEPKWLG